MIDITEHLAGQEVPVMDKDVITIEEIEHIAKRNLAGQRFLLRRGWGVVYAFWATFMVYSLFLSDIADLFSLKGNVALILNVITYLVVVSVAILALSRTARMWGRTMKLSSALEKGRPGRPIILIWALLIFIAAAIAEVFLPDYAQVIFYANLLPLTFVVYYIQKRVFSDRLPIEGALAIITLFISVVLSLTIAVLGIPGKDLVIQVIWTFTLIIWFFASFYALFHAPEELGVFNEEQE